MHRIWLVSYLALGLAAPSAHGRTASVSWRVPVQFPAGVAANGLAMDANNRVVWHDDWTHLVKRNVRNGKRLRRVTLGEEKRDNIMQVSLHAGRVLVFDEEEPSEESMGRPQAATPGASGTLWSLDVVTGKRVWKVEGRFALPVVGAGSTVLMVRNERLVAVDADSGAERWKSPKLGPMHKGPAATTSTAIVQNAVGEVSGFSVRTGRRSWSRRIAGRTTTRPAMDVRFVVLTRYRELEPGQLRMDRARNSTILALDLRTGKERWRRKLPGRLVPHRPAMASRIVYICSEGDVPVGATGSRLHALSLDNGKTLWEAEGSGPMAIQNDRLLFWSEAPDTPDTCSRLRCRPFSRLNVLDARTGKRLWSRTIRVGEKAQMTVPVVSAGRVLSSDGKRLFAIPLPPPRRRQPD